MHVKAHLLNHPFANVILLFIYLISFKQLILFGFAIII